MNAQQLAKLIAVRAGHTFWQSFSATAAVLWTASGLDVTQLTDVSAVEKLLAALAAAAAAAALSAVKSVTVATLASPTPTVTTPAAGVFTTVEPTAGPQTLPGVFSAADTVLADLPVGEDIADTVLDDLPYDPTSSVDTALSDTGDTDDDLTPVTV